MIILPCTHDEGQRSFAAVENGQCPICLRGRLRAIKDELEHLINQVHNKTYTEIKINLEDISNEII